MKYLNFKGAQISFIWKIVKHDEIQLLTSDCIQLLNKPYVNGEILRKNKTENTVSASRWRVRLTILTKKIVTLETIKTD